MVSFKQIVSFSIFIYGFIDSLIDGIISFTQFEEEETSVFGRIYQFSIQLLSDNIDLDSYASRSESRWLSCILKTIPPIKFDWIKAFDLIDYLM